MKKSDKQTLDMLHGEFEKSVSSAKIPLRLQKESIVGMIENNEREIKDFSDKTGTKNGNTAVLRRLTAAAAMLAIVVACALFMRMGGVKVIKTDSFYKGYEGRNPVRNAQSYEEVEKAVLDILDGKSGEAGKIDSAEKTDGNGSSEPATEGVVDRIIEGYSKYVAGTKQPDGSSEAYVAESSAFKAHGISVSGDFEADIVKNNGEYLYIVTTGTDSKTGSATEQIKIVKAVPADKMETVSTIVLSSADSADTIDECIEIYLKNNKLIALMRRYSYSMTGTAAFDKLSTVAVYYDISDPTAPKKIREHIQDGEYVASSLHENRLCLVTEKSIPLISDSKKFSESGVIPTFSVNGSGITLRAEDIFIAVNDPKASYLFITVTDISDSAASVGRLAVLGCGNEVFCSPHSVTVSRGFVSVDSEKSLTEIYRFNINGSAISFGGSYVAEGTLVSGLSVDEKSGYLRAATTDTDSSNIYLLNDKMEFVSGLEGIFRGEKIRSVKFIGSNGYVVAGDNNEKTMIIDFSDYSKPKVAGMISTSGFYENLCAVSGNMLIGVAAGAPDESGSGEVTISLFDVSDPDNPKTAAVYSLGGECSLPAAGDSRCVVLNSDKTVFGIPVIINNPAAGTQISAYLLFDVSDGKISPVGTYNHDTSVIGDAAVRGIFINGTLYTVSGQKISAFSVDDAKIISSLEI